MPFSIPQPRPWRLAWLLVLAFFLVDGVGSVAHAQELHLANLVLNNFEGTIRVRFGVEPTGIESIRQVLDAGETLVLRCKAKLSMVASTSAIRPGATAPVPKAQPIPGKPGKANGIYIMRSSAGLSVR